GVAEAAQEGDLGALEGAAGDHDFFGTVSALDIAGQILTDDSRSTLPLCFNSGDEVVQIDAEVCLTGWSWEPGGIEEQVGGGENTVGFSQDVAQAVSPIEIWLMERPRKIADMEVG